MVPWLVSLVINAATAWPPSVQVQGSSGPQWRPFQRTAISLFNVDAQNSASSAPGAGLQLGLSTRWSMTSSGESCPDGDVIDSTYHCWHWEGEFHSVFGCDRDQIEMIRQSDGRHFCVPSSHVRLDVTPFQGSLLLGEVLSFRGV